MLWSRLASLFRIPKQSRQAEWILPQLRQEGCYLGGSEAALLAATVVAVCVEAVVVVADDYHEAGVVGTVAAAAFAVVVRGVRVEAGAAVIGVAFARFGFFGFDSFRFFACFGLGAFARCGSLCAAARRRATFLDCDSACFPMATLHSGLLGFQGNPLPGFLLGARCFVAGSTPSRNQS